MNRTVTHSGDPRLARHIGNATVRTDNRGTRIYKEHKHSTRRIDLAVCAIMAHSGPPPPQPGNSAATGSSALAQTMRREMRVLMIVAPCD